MTELEQALVALGAELEFPPTPDLTGAVRARLGPRRRWLRPAAFALAVVVVAFGIAMAVPDARSAILRFFHIGAATVEQVETLPPAQQRPLVAGLGPALARAGAEKVAGLRIQLPRVRAPLRYYAQPGLIATLLRVNGTPVLLAEIRDDQTAFAKKAVQKQTTVEPVQLGEFGLWLAGPQHVLMWQFGSPAVHVVETRLAGNVLIWVRGGITYRLEGALDKSQMLALGRQITP
jgi:hypothetical protein